MATILQNNQGKRRNRSSTTSTSSTESSNKSPAQKKSKNIEESEDEVITALNMVEELSTKIEAILMKVEKLDSIASSVNNIEATLASLENRTTKLEKFQKSASKDIDDLKESYSFIDDKIDSFKEEQNQIKGLTEKLKESDEKIKKQEKEIEDLKSKDLYLEAYSRRENLKFLNIEEREDEDVEEVLRSFLRDDLYYEEYEYVEIQRIHRNGRKVGSKPRPILARFLRYKDCEKILSLGRNLKGTNFQIFSDLPYELVKRRKMLMPTFKKARENKIPASFSKSEPDKLYVRRKLWQVGDELMNL